MLRDARQKAGFFLSDSLEVTNFSPRVPQIAVSCPDDRAQCALPTCLRSISEVQPGRTDLPGSKMAELCSLASNLFRKLGKRQYLFPNHAECHLKPSSGPGAPLKRQQIEQTGAILSVPTVHRHRRNVS